MIQNALGLIESKSIASAIVAADIIVKSSKVDLIFKETAGEGLFTLYFQGELGVLKSAVENAVVALKKKRETLSHYIIPCPHEEIYNLIFNNNNSSEICSAFGVIETKGLIGLIAAADSMLKTSIIRIINKENLPGILVALKIEGEIEHVNAALTAGAETARKVGQFIRTSIINNPDEKVKFLIENTRADKNHVKVEEPISKDANIKIKLSKGKFIQNKTKQPNKVVKKTETLPEHKIEGKTEQKKEKIQKANYRDNGEISLFESFEADIINESQNNSSEIENNINKDEFHAVEEKSDKNLIDTNRGIKYEELEKLSVSKLRRLARDIENFPIKGRTISMANKNLLLEHFKPLLL